MKNFNPQENYQATRKDIGYVSRKEATEKDYKRIGFKSGLEVHQQLNTVSKLFCRCPAGIYNDSNDYDAEIIRHMRPTLSELGVYDGTALMEFKTKKEITYRIKNETACTYEVDDTPPFPIDRQALDIALEISLLSKMNIVGEVHITRKQYLDGSIPTGFQRTAILGVEGSLQLSNKKVRLIQLSIEEDSCREISDIGHKRVYKTDRLGMPLIETVTYPDMATPSELMEAAEYIRFLNRSTGKVRTGIGAGREDVNVSCEGGSRVEIKGVAHNSWIPELSHNESFRQYALLNIRKLLLKRIKEPEKWKIGHVEIKAAKNSFESDFISEALNKGHKVFAVNLPGCKGILSHFTQPGHAFADELIHRLKVIACIEYPNMVYAENPFNPMDREEQEALSHLLKASEDDSPIIICGPEDDIPTALETIEERIKMAFEGVPEETRKSFSDGTTIFERVLPGRDRMYPDTDSPPIPLPNDHIERLRKSIPADVADRIAQLVSWEIPPDTWRFLLSRNMIPLIEKISVDFKIDPGFLGKFLGHRFRNLCWKNGMSIGQEKIYALFRFMITRNLNLSIAEKMLKVLIEHPEIEFESILVVLKFKEN